MPGSDLPANWVALEQAVLRGPGSLGAGVRQALAARAGRLAGLDAGEGGPKEPAPELIAYADRVAGEAHAIADGEVARLLGAGHGEDAVFEATVAAAFGAGVARLRQALRVLGEPSP